MYFANIERFGYEYMTIGRTKKEVFDTMSNWYIDMFKQYNDGEDPRDTYDYFFRTPQTYYKTFTDELYIDKVKSGEVICI